MATIFIQKILPKMNKVYYKFFFQFSDQSSFHRRMQGLFPRGFAKVWLGAYGGIEETLWNFIRRKYFFFIKEINKLWSEHKNTLKFRFQQNERSRSDLSIKSLLFCHIIPENTSYLCIIVSLFVLNPIFYLVFPWSPNFLAYRLHIGN